MDWKCVGVILMIGCPLFGQETSDDFRTTTMESIQDDSLAQSLNSFGYKLMIEIMKKNEYNLNIAISPTSIASVLAMTLLGSVGKTYDEMADILGFSRDMLTNRKNHEEFGELLQALSTNTSSKTMYANAIFVDKDTHLREVFRNYLEMVYHGEALGTEFGDGVKARQVINEWVKEHTKNKIEDFLQQPLPESTKVVLLSALYFSGQWEKPFLPEYTKKLPFKTPTKEVMTDLMANFGNFHYIFSVEDQLHMVAFPYNDSVTKMYVLKPRIPRRLNIFDLLNKLDYLKIESLINRMTSKTCVIRFPKMELRSNVKLEVPLKALGVNTMFNPSEANFALMIDGNNMINQTETELISRINTGDLEARGLNELINELVNPAVHVDSVIHEVKMTVNEFGTEVVAATSAVTTRSAEMFYADSPFYVFIRNEKTKLITLSAIIFDPSV
ncbi:serine protease inhibitor 28Dc-like [Achroia grisella]|uniref:serine protease inhibitor 28Dc-like n=1 Tax=Achroia grisella TaxID=688607 RepID=UPI0027D31E5D|nr:serine protease inhibitor 28Dc-like [Achroia grisella]